MEDVHKTLQLEVTKLQEIELPSPQEKEDWTEGVFVGKEKGNFHVDLPREYRYNEDIRLQGTNSFLIKDDRFYFSLVGEEISKFFSFPENLSEFKNSINAYLEKLFSGIQKSGLEMSDKNFKLHIVETKNSWWCRGTFSYKMDTKTYWKDSGYNLLGKALVKLFAGNSMQKAGYEKNKKYEEYKIVDFFYPKNGGKYPFFALVYAFDEVTGGDTRKMLRTINGISDSLGYYDER